MKPANPPDDPTATRHPVDWAAKPPSGAGRSAVMIGNLRSRRTAELFARARHALAQGGISVLESQTVRDGKDMRERVRKAVKAGHELVIVAGGDGSLTSVVGFFAHQSTVLGVLPFGTGNSFAKSLGIAATVEEAVEVIVSGKVAKVDLGIVNDTYFANFATIGLSSTIGRSTPAALKKVFGPAAYGLAGIGPTLTSRAFEAKLRWDDHKLSVSTHQLIIANGRYYGFTPILPNATIVDGTLSVFTTNGLSRWDVAKMFVALSRGDQTQLENAEYFSTKEVTIKTKPRQSLDVDGEALGKTPARFSIARAALKVMVPQDFTGG